MIIPVSLLANMTDTSTVVGLWGWGGGGAGWSRGGVGVVRDRVGWSRSGVGVGWGVSDVGGGAEYNSGIVHGNTFKTSSE